MDEKGGKMKAAGAVNGESDGSEGVGQAELQATI